MIPYPPPGKRLWKIFRFFSIKREKLKQDRSVYSPCATTPSKKTFIVAPPSTEKIGHFLLDVCSCWCFWNVRKELCFSPWKLFSTYFSNDCFHSAKCVSAHRQHRISKFCKRNVLFLSLSYKSPPKQSKIIRWTLRWRCAAFQFT